jgi:hypothetical protein
MAMGFYKDDEEYLGSIQPEIEGAVLARVIPHVALHHSRPLA